MPQAEQRRQRAAYRRGITRAASLATLVLSSMGVLTAWALDSANRANLQSQRRAQEALKARRYLQAANMNLAQVEWNAGRLWRVRDLLDECRPGPGESDLRGFEWNLLHRRGHFDLPALRNPSIYAAGRLIFSRDGMTLFVDDLHGTALHWSLATGDQLPHSPTQPSLDARNQQRDPAGRFHVSGETVHEEELQSIPASLLRRHATRAEVVLRDRHTGRAVRRLPGSMAPWAFSADGKILATQQLGRRGLALWSVSTGRRIGLLPAQAPFAFSPDGSRLAARSPAHGEAVQLFDLAANREPRVLDAGEAVDFALQSPGGTLLLQNDTLRSARTLEVVGRLPGGMTGIAFLAEDRLAVTQDASPGDLVILDPRSFREVARARNVAGKGHKRGDIDSGVLSADGRRLALGLGGESSYVVVLDATSLAVVARFLMRGPVDTSGSFALSPDGRSLILPEANAAGLWAVDSGKRQRTFGNAGPPFAFSPFGSLLATGSPGHYGSASLWDLSTGRRLFRLLGHRYSLHTAVFSPDGKRLLTGDGGEYAVKAWDTATGRETWTLPGITSRTDVPSYSLFFAPDGSRLYSGNQENTLKAWEIR